MDSATRIVAAMTPLREADIIPLLQRLQEAYGYLPRDVILAVAQRTGLPASRIYGVATFYSQFHLEPHGRHVIRCCRGTACHVRGSKKILETIKRDFSLEEGGTTPDIRFGLEVVRCLGTCFLAPVMMVDNDYYGRLTPQQVKSVLVRYT